MSNRNIVRVTAERWRYAQALERELWIQTQKARARFGKNLLWRLLAAVGIKPRYRGDDWNEWWARQFDGYAFLPGIVHNAIELGCGPYTNLRLIADRCQLDRIVLSDPLIHTYVKFHLTFVSDMYRRGLCVLDDHSLEDCPFADNTFDLVVMINVLDHVQDADVCVRKAVGITRPGGCLLIGQDLSNESDVNAMEGRPGDGAHPVKLDHEWMEERLQDRFDVVLKRLLPRDQGRGPAYHYGTLVFAGRKRPPASISPRA